MSRCSCLVCMQRSRHFAFLDGAKSKSISDKKVQVGDDQQKAQSERNFHSKNRRGGDQIDN